MPTPPGRRFLDAAVKPLHLLPPGLGAMAAGGLLVAGFPPLAIAVGALSMGAWGAMVAWDLVTPAPPVPTPPPPDPLAGIRTERLRALLMAVRRAGARVTEQVEAHDGAVSPSLVASPAATSSSSHSAAISTRDGEATRRADGLWTQLSAVDQAVLGREQADRAAAASHAADPEVARALQLAADAKSREMTTWRELGRLVERIAAELVAAEASLDELHARVIRVTHDDPADASAGGAQVRDQVKELAGRLQVLERSAAETLKEIA